MRPTKQRAARAGRKPAVQQNTQPHGEARPLISACLIVKNEEANLPRCLSSISTAVDEIILVDTGSTDRTVEIAQEFGARIFHFEWCDDFSAARNESLRHARGEWIIWVDGDDELVEVQPGALRQLCTAELQPDWGYWVTVRSPYGETGDQQVDVQHWRIFKNNRGIWFRGRIHEEPWPPEKIGPHQLGSQNDVSVTHWGYVPRGNILELKSARNRHLLELSIQEEPWQPLHYYNLGRQQSREGDAAGALETLSKGLDLWFEHGQPNWSFAHSLFSFTAQSAVDSGAFERTIEIESKAPDRLVSAELLCNAGKAYWMLGRREEAIARLNRAWQDPSVINPHLHDVSKSTWQPLLMLSGLYDQIGETEQAYACAQKAAGFAADHPEILLAAGYLADKLGLYDESADWLHRLLEGARDEGFKAQGRRVLLHVGQVSGQPELQLEALAGEIRDMPEPEFIRHKAEALAQSGEVQAAFDMLQDGFNRFPDNWPVRFALADFLAGHGYDNEALNVLGSGLDLPDAPAELYRRLSLLLSKAGRLEDAANALELYAQASAGPAAVPVLS